MDRIAFERLRWKCRRGLLELDLILQRFFQSESAREEKMLLQLNQLLDLPDNDLLDIFSGRSEDFDPRFGGLVARLRSC